MAAESCVLSCAVNGSCDEVSCWQEDRFELEVELEVTQELCRRGSFAGLEGKTKACGRANMRTHRSLSITIAFLSFVSEPGEQTCDSIV